MNSTTKNEEKREAGGISYVSQTENFFENYVAGFLLKNHFATLLIRNSLYSFSILLLNMLLNIVNSPPKYDVVILGGGLAGLTLALQLKLSNPGISVLVLEKRLDLAPVSTHKVGESISELGAHYLRDVLQLKEYLIEHQLPKLGFRFFFSPEHKENIARRVEVGSKITRPFPTHQIDRGIFENELVDNLRKRGVEIILGATVEQVNLDKSGHQIHFEKGGINDCRECKWVIDSTGRRSLLKRKLGLEKTLDHKVNAAWFRLAGEIDIDDWSEEKDWCAFFGKGYRRLGTNHLMGEGYWVWIIPLVSGNTSIGIVADPSFHPFDRFNTFEKAMSWLESYEPVAANMLGKHKDELIDFKVMRHFSHDSKQFYSADRWGITGDAGTFLDAFYSPGTDFIALGNSWLAELILRDINGENISLRSMIYEHAHKEILKGWILLYKSMYGLFGKTQIMLMKIIWDWGSYWSIPCLMFMNEGYTKIDVLKRYSAASNSLGLRFSKLNENMQKLFLDWSQYEIETVSDHHINIFDLDCLNRFHLELEKKHDPEMLVKKIESNLEILEQISAEIFRLVCAQVHGTPLDLRVDPYHMSLSDSREELLKKSKGKSARGAVESIRSDISKMWFISLKKEDHEYV